MGEEGTDAGGGISVLGDLATDVGVGDRLGARCDLVIERPIELKNDMVATEVNQFQNEG